MPKIWMLIRLKIILWIMSIVWASILERPITLWMRLFLIVLRSWVSMLMWMMNLCWLVDILSVECVLREGKCVLIGRWVTTIAICATHY